MARRKRYLEDGDDSDSAGYSDEEISGEFNLESDPDKRAEHELFEDPYRRKRRRTGGKDDATYGVFGEDSDEEEGFGKRKARPVKRSDWTKAPSFVSGEKATATTPPDITNPEVEVDEVENIDDGSQHEEQSEGIPAEEDRDMRLSSDESNPASPRVHLDDDEDELEAKPKFGGIGMKSQKTSDIAAPTPTPSISSGIGFNRGGIGAAKAGIGSKAPPTSEVAHDSLPSSFGASRPQRSFLRGETVSGPSSRPATPMSTAEKVHFNKLEGSFGARMLSKMGWQTGTGLGTEGVGIVTPVEVKLRPTKMGIAFRGFREKTEQSKAEARRRGEVVSDDEGPASKVKGKGKQRDQTPRADVWTRPKRQRTKIAHKTYEEIIAETSDEAQPAGIGIIIDATGATPREVASLADVSTATWTPTGDSMRIPEVRHNLRLIADACRVDLAGLAREAKLLEDRRKWVEDEDPRLRRKVENEAELIERLQAVHLVVDDINSKSRELTKSDYEPSLDVFAIPIEKLTREFEKEYSRYHVDEIVVAAIVPTFRRMVSLWRPLDEPAAFTDLLRRWRSALGIIISEERPELAVDVFGSSTVHTELQSSPSLMTPYESLLWNIWLPKIRSAINNEWSPADPRPAVKLYETWSDLLPPFIRDNFLDQLVLPKVSAAVSNWNARKDKVSLRAIVFPWLPHVGLRMETFVEDARRKVKSIIRSWSPKDGPISDLSSWKEVFDASEWDNILLKYIVPKLGSLLRDDFRVNPRNQKLEPLLTVLQWADILRPTIIGQLLEVEFFSKWLEVLHIWLIQPTVNFGEVAEWYKSWKDTFPINVQRIPVIEQGFSKGLQMMDQALELGADAPKRLPKPSFARRSATPDQIPAAKVNVRPHAARTQEITFRSIVEEFAASHNLLFMPAGKVHEKSRLPLFRVSRSADGKGGILVYLLDDALWFVDGDDYRAISLEDMVLKASSKS